MRRFPSIDALIWVAAFVVLGALLHLGLPYFIDGDTGYHLAVARLIREHGLPDAFPWTSFSWLADRYADKELLFHLLLVPLAGLEPGLAASIAGAGLAALLLSTLYALLRAEGVPTAGLWTLLAFSCSGAFVYRIALVRPHLLSIPLALVVLWAAVRRRPRVLAAAAFAYPFAYTAWHLPAGLVVIAALARRAGGGALEWRPLALTLACLVAAIVVHPDFPHNLSFFWIQNVEVLLGAAWGGAEGIELGGEFRPFSPAGWLRWLTIPCLLLAFSLRPAWAARRRDALPLAALVAALGFLALTLRTQRFVEYLVPFAALTAAVCHRGRPHAPLALATALALGWTALVSGDLVDRAQRRDVLFPQAVKRVLRGLVPPGSQVLTCDWQFTGEMMLALPGRRFMVALDPVLFARRHPELHRTWHELVRRPPADPARIARDRFDADFVLCDSRARWAAFRAALDADPRARLRARAGVWRLWEVAPGFRPVPRDAGLRPSPPAPKMAAGGDAWVDRTVP